MTGQCLPRPGSRACPGGGRRAVPCPCLLTTLRLCVCDLQDWIKEEPADSLVYGVFQALEELR